MKIKYNLNLKLFEFGIVMSTIARFQGLLAFEYECSKALADIDEPLRNFIKYAIDLITDGTDPIYVEFLLSEELKIIERQYSDNAELLNDVRLMKFILQQIQSGQGDSIQTLLNSIDDRMLKSEYLNWAHLNQFDHRVTFEESKTLTSEERLRIMDSNPMVKKIFEDMFKK